MSCFALTDYAENCLVKSIGKPYLPAASGAPKAYDRKNNVQSFNQAKFRCEMDGATLVMPKTATDIEDLKDHACE